MAFHVRKDHFVTRIPSWKTQEAAMNAAASIGECRVGIVIPTDKESPDPKDYDGSYDHWCVLKENGQPYTALELGEARDLYNARRG